jgi:hypothetical protein
MRVRVWPHRAAGAAHARVVRDSAAALRELLSTEERCVDDIRTCPIGDTRQHIARYNCHLPSGIPSHVQRCTEAGFTSCGACRKERPALHPEPTSRHVELNAAACDVLRCPGGPGLQRLVFRGAILHVACCMRRLSLARSRRSGMLSPAETGTLKLVGDRSAPGFPPSPTAHTPQRPCHGTARTETGTSPARLRGGSALPAAQRDHICTTAWRQRIAGSATRPHRRARRPLSSSHGLGSPLRCAYTIRYGLPALSTPPSRALIVASN